MLQGSTIVNYIVNYKGHNIDPCGTPLTWC